MYRILKVKLYFQSYNLILTSSGEIVYIAYRLNGRQKEDLMLESICIINKINDAFKNSNYIYIASNKDKLLEIAGIDNKNFEIIGIYDRELPENIQNMDKGTWVPPKTKNSKKDKENQLIESHTVSISADNVVIKIDYTVFCSKINYYDYIKSEIENYMRKSLEIFDCVDILKNEDEKIKMLEDSDIGKKYHLIVESLDNKAVRSKII